MVPDCLLSAHSGRPAFSRAAGQQNLGSSSLGAPKRSLEALGYEDYFPFPFLVFGWAVSSMTAITLGLACVRRCCSTV
jgi:hypothetical protein